MLRAKNTNKVRRRVIWMSSALAVLLACLFMGTLLWNGEFMYGSQILCQKSGSPIVGFFRYEKKENKVSALWDKNQTCTTFSHGGSDGWEPFALKLYKVQESGVCRWFGEPILYNFKQGASALGGSYRLDIVQDSPFFHSNSGYAKQFENAKNYCDDTDQSWCPVKLVSVCREQSPLQPANISGAVTRCHSPQIRASNYSDNYGPLDSLAAVMMLDQKGNGGFAYTMSEYAAPLKGGVVLAQGIRGEVYCYYHADSTHPLGVAGVTFPAVSRNEAVQGCMAVLTDQNKYCPSKAMPHFREF